VLKVHSCLSVHSFALSSHDHCNGVDKSNDCGDASIICDVGMVVGSGDVSSCGVTTRTAAALVGGRAAVASNG